jgi:predicted dithiol-disulfide oxidoreductase (DUF899 family)
VRQEQAQGIRLWRWWRPIGRMQPTYLADSTRRAILASLASGEEGPGAWVFYWDETGDLFHTFSCYGGLDMLGAYNHLD